MNQQERLRALPLRACHWLDDHGDEQLLLLLGARGQLLHCSRLGPTLHMRACCTVRLTRRHELLSDAAESVATAIAVWVWQQSMAPERSASPTSSKGAGGGGRLPMQRI